MITRNCSKICGTSGVFFIFLAFVFPNPNVWCWWDIIKQILHALVFLIYKYSPLVR